MVCNAYLALTPQLGNVVGTAFRTSMSEHDLQTWGWRVPFIMVMCSRIQRLLSMVLVDQHIFTMKRRM